MKEVDRSLVGLPDFKSGERLKKSLVGSIPMHFRQFRFINKLNLKMIDSFKIKIIVTLFLIFASFSSAKGENAYKKFTDETNRVVILKSFPPKKIISLSPNVTEILFKLGLDNEIIGVTKECNFPADTAKKTRVGDYVNINMELLVSLAPDLIIISAEGDARGQTENMERLSLPVYAVKTKGLADLIKTIKDIGAVTGKEEEGRALAKTVEDEVAFIKNSLKDVKRKSVFCAVGVAPLIGAGPKTLIGDVIKTCGGDNIIDENAPDYPMINIEELYVKEPDVILLSSMGSEVVKASDNSELKLFSNLKAAKNGALFIVNADILCRPSYRIVDALRDIAKKMYPDKFNFAE